MNTTIHITTEQFLEDLYDSNEAIIFFNTDGKTWCKKPQAYSEAKSKLKKCNEIYKCDIYFIPNSGGSKNSQITAINSLFIDWDAGRDENKKYFPIEVVQQKKQEFLQKLAQFPHKPTYIIETRNGFHVYWFLYPGTTSEQYILVQKALVEYFDSDPKVGKLAQVMKLPGYSSTKKGEYSPFLVSIIEHNPVRYSVDIFMSYFSLSSPQKETESTEYQSTHPPEVTFSAHNNIYEDKDITGNIIMGTKPRSFDTMEQVVDHLCKQNIAQYWGLSEHEQVYDKAGLTILCPFHSDDTPSASIYYYEGYCYLKCHSSNCEFGAGTIIKAVEGKENISEGQAVIKLMEYYNIKLDDSWKDEEEKKYNNNIEIIKQPILWKEQYPDLYRCVNRIKKDLLSKLLFGKTHIQLRTSEGKSLFFCSLTEFERISCGNDQLYDQGIQNQKVDRYCLLGLMEKMDQSEVPYGLYRKMEYVRGTKHFKYRMQCYHIPEYTPALLQKADDIARRVKNSGMKLNSITKNSIRDIFGEIVAKRIYPQVEHIRPTDSGAVFKCSVQEVMLEEIDKKGYTTASEIKEGLMGAKTWKSVHDRRVKEHLPGLLIKHRLVEVTSNKKLKEQYNIESKGYPKIIVRQIENSAEKSSNITILKKEVAA